MRLYRTEAGPWAGTQAEASRLAIDTGGHAKSWQEIDLPTTKAELLDWLNRNVGAASVEAARAERELDRLREQQATQNRAPHPRPPEPTAPPKHDGKAMLDRSIKIDELIQSATLPETIRLFEQVAWRLDEHRRAIAAAGIAPAI